MIPITFDIVEKAIAEFSKDIEKQRFDAHTKLKTFKSTNQREKDYLDKIIPLFDVNNDIITAKPQRLREFLSKGTNGIKLPVNTNKDFSERILNCLQYKNLRETFYPEFFSKLGIKACVYCNSQLTVVTKNANGKFSARFDFDHNINKSDYPFLSISLYNLYPVCASCNRKKHKHNIPFELYQENFQSSDYHFGLGAGGVAKYLVSQNATDISIDFEPKDSELNKKLGVKEIYDTQKDLVEEMIVKSRIYNESYIATLKNSFQSLFNNPDLFDRVIYGNYMKEEEIHKRPMSKFTQDITKELKEMTRK